MPEFYTELSSVGKPPNVDTDKLKSVIESIKTPRHAIVLAGYRTVIRGLPELLVLYTQRVASIAEKFTLIDVADLQDSLGRTKVADEQSMFQQLTKRAGKSDLVGSRH